MTKLPDLFLREDGSRIRTPAEWVEHRSVLQSLMVRHLYGPIPPDPGNTTGTILKSEVVCKGSALREKVLLQCGPGSAISFEVTVLRPNKPGRFPAISWIDFSAAGEQPSPIEEHAVCERGYCIARFLYKQLATDEPDSCGPVHAAYPELPLKCIAIWGWGHMRVVDYLRTTDHTDPERIIAAGHSRCGKATLCAGIFDDRIALTAPIGSGCGGSGCFRILGGKDGAGTGRVETLDVMVTRFPHWFVGPDLPPFDLHTAKALIAPRLLFTSDGLDDEWANPYGTRKSWEAAGEVFRFLGVPENSGIHFRPGAHAFNREDWTALLDFSDLRLRPAPRADSVDASERGRYNYHLDAEQED